jgi:hypothetical protein
MKKGWLKFQPPLVLNRITACGLGPARLSIWGGDRPLMVLRPGAYWALGDCY